MVANAKSSLLKSPYHITSLYKNSWVVLQSFFAIDLPKDGGNHHIQHIFHGNSQILLGGMSGLSGISCPRAPLEHPPKMLRKTRFCSTGICTRAECPNGLPLATPRRIASMWSWSGMLFSILPSARQVLRSSPTARCEKLFERSKPKGWSSFSRFWHIS